MSLMSDPKVLAAECAVYFWPHTALPTSLKFDPPSANVPATSIELMFEINVLGTRARSTVTPLAASLAADSAMATLEKMSLIKEPNEDAALFAVYFAAQTFEAMSERKDALLIRERISLKASLLPRVAERISLTSLASRESRSDRRDRISSALLCASDAFEAPKIAAECASDSIPLITTR